MVEAPKKESIWDTWRPRVYTESTVAGAVALPVSWAEQAFGIIQWRCVEKCKCVCWFYC